MRKYVTVIVLAVFVAMSLCVMPVFAQDNVIDKAGDWFATLGKKEPEKGMILTQRRAARAAKRAEKQMKEGAKEMQKGMEGAFGK